MCEGLARPWQGWAPPTVPRPGCGGTDRWRPWPGGTRGLGATQIVPLVLTGSRGGPMKDLGDLPVLSLDNQVGMALVLLHSVTTEGLCEFRVFYCSLRRVWPWAEVRVVVRCSRGACTRCPVSSLWRDLRKGSVKPLMAVRSLENDP